MHTVVQEIMWYILLGRPYAIFIVVILNAIWKTLKIFGKSSEKFLLPNHQAYLVILYLMEKNIIDKIKIAYSFNEYFTTISSSVDLGDEPISPNWV